MLVAPVRGREDQFWRHLPDRVLAVQPIHVLHGSHAVCLVVCGFRVGVDQEWEGPKGGEPATSRRGRRLRRVFSGKSGRKTVQARDASAVGPEPFPLAPLSWWNTAVFQRISGSLRCVRNFMSSVMIRTPCGSAWASAAEEGPCRQVACQGQPQP